MEEPRIAIVVNGGVVESVVCSAPAEYVVLDYDVINDGSEDGLREARKAAFCQADVDKSLRCVAEFVREAGDKLDDVLSDREEEDRRDHKRGLYGDEGP
jgi:hypothetical protein